ncbi:alpha/beta hydrolase [Nocardioides daeguensis]|uniref:Alpha/beta hydrolase-fold protein n=1 Tax=Nocardioides daeguensis TaxID=908359 RepID=A0ABP6UWY8_9ACTN|nr:alpha/beta hydrolase-fold protein [Nocardioides daeguensis]MBV6728717.1 esterase family protein [Nocardioides daeguensis]MCR1773673.1 esterase family protein [Nocardioides daeguensis]
MTRSEPRPGRRLSRRGLLGAGGGVVALGAAGAAGAAYRHRTDDGPDGVVPHVRGGEPVSGSFVSAARKGATCGWSIATPWGGRFTDGPGPPVVVVLHGRRNDHASAFARSYLALDRFLAAGIADGMPPVAIASVDGGDTYWHARRSGEDAGAMVVDEFLPLLAQRGLDTSRIGLLGWSMGGFGALHLTPALGDAVKAVGVMSPALWHRYDDTSPGAFDDAADFARMTVFGRENTLADVPLRVDCGTGDPFYAATRDFVRDLPERPAGGFSRGDHDIGYWRRVVPKQLRFLAEALDA